MDFDENLWRVGHGPGNNLLDFGGDPDSLSLFCTNYSLCNAFLMGQQSFTVIWQLYSANKITRTSRY